jgi:hypothetical protein
MGGSSFDHFFFLSCIVYLTLYRHWASTKGVTILEIPSIVPKPSSSLPGMSFHAGHCPSETVAQKHIALQLPTKRGTIAGDVNAKNRDRGHSGLMPHGANGSGSDFGGLVDIDERPRLSTALSEDTDKGSIRSFNQLIPKCNWS